MTGESKKIFPTQTSNYWVGIVIILVGILGVFIYFDQRIKGLEEIVSQATLSRENIVSGAITPAGEGLKKEISEMPQEIPESAWQEIAALAGTGNIKTDSFIIPSGQWRVRWKLELNPEKIGLFSFGAYRQTDDELVESASFNSLLGMTHYSQGTYIYEGKTSYYLDIKAENLAGWDIKMESL
ncbi:MAG: hypothetical protein COV64_00395 [Candidatus Nealsonbacteria bacterium CG11_big_fil_rev_8_21_14_0_20_39_9]|uniref:Uncharacterized protein n=1 Tax=Candidatus Nealsonbacteria bacterium CG11_big_fil_rev_8_21_14_0_20_39_9 TaxID=1974715 RepID=A0A2H0MPK8_9BACT|nr:MAG: hypothetical protein COV64_00395 [Candidatus Nealsonbacteria bacterium CG11_big_fil_rev_8_21_14_0_20_39_9]